MNVKPRTNLVLDTVILVLFLVVLVSGLLLWTVYPSGGIRAGRGHNTSVSETVVLGLDKHTMVTLHDWSGLIVGLLALVHLVFHWRWIMCQSRRLFQRTPTRHHRPRSAADTPCRDA